MKFNFILLTYCFFFAFGCNSEIETKEKMKTSIMQYLDIQMKKDKSSQYSVDSISIMSIDTLTQRSAAEFRLNALLVEHEKHRKYSQSLIDLINSYKLLNMDKFIIDKSKRDLNTAISNWRPINDSINSVKNSLDKLDNVNFKYYLITLKGYLIVDQAAKIVDLKIPLNEKLQVVEFLDL